MHGAQIDFQPWNQESTLVHNGRDVLPEMEACQIIAHSYPLTIAA
jgi:hypothetical protein